MFKRKSLHLFELYRHAMEPVVPVKTDTVFSCIYDFLSYWKS